MRFGDAALPRLRISFCQGLGFGLVIVLACRPIVPAWLAQIGMSSLTKKTCSAHTYISIGGSLVAGGSAANVAVSRSSC